MPGKLLYHIIRLGKRTITVPTSVSDALLPYVPKDKWGEEVFAENESLSSASEMKDKFKR